MTFFRFMLISLLALIAQSVQAVTCQNNIPASNPDSAYTVHGDGTATDTRTGLMWKVCAEGQTWSNGTCSGSATAHTWANALALAESAVYAGHSDWRLPNVKELNSLLEECRVSPSVNDSVFPATPSSDFWSGSPYAGYRNGAWYVDFSYGYAYGNDRDLDPGIVRLVRNFTGTAPGAPTITRLMPGNGSMRIAFVPPVITGGAAITSYTASCFRNGVIRTATGASSPITVTGLTNRVSYTCTVSATNSLGTGTASLEATKVVRPASIAPILNILMD